MVEGLKKIEVLVVDDSAFMRVALKKMMEADDRIVVADVARNGIEALEKIKRHRFDLVTLDIEMPGMDGLAVLEKIMKEMPLPVIMISSLTEEGAEATFRALELGAVDFIPKGGKSYVNLDIVKIGEQLRHKIHGITSRDRMRRLRQTVFGSPGSVGALSRKALPPLDESRKPNRKCQLAVLGISTGGPLALNQMLPLLPESFRSPLMIVQHMPPTFTGPFAKRLDSVSKVSVKEAADGDLLEPGCVYVAAGGIHMKLRREGFSKHRIMLDPEPADRLFVPSVDVMMESAAAAFPGTILGVIMTGMGNDGMNGIEMIHKKGGVTLAQDEESCVVYGMPKVCVEKGIIDRVVPLAHMAEVMNEFAG